MEDFAPPVVPDELNYAMAPVYHEWMERRLHGNYNDGPLQLPPEKRDNSPKLVSRQKSFVRAGWIAKASNSASADVLTGLERLEPTLAQIRLATERPKSRWPVNWSEGPKAQMVHYGILQDVASVFALRARALLAEGRADEALAELHHAARAAHSLDQEPTITPALAKLAMWALITDAARDGIMEERWSGDQLIALQNELGQTNVLADWRSALESERGLGNSIYEELFHADSATLGMSMVGQKLPGFLIPRGWVRYIQLEYNQQRDLDLSDIDAGAELAAPAFSRAMARVGTRSNYVDRARYYLCDSWVPLVTGGNYRAFESHSRMQQFRILCALSRYRMRNGGLPESLEELAPAYLPSIPHDIMDGQPMRYQRDKTGGCRVWSIGRNRVDDGGAVFVTKSGIRRDPDWVSELPPRH